MAGGVGSWEVVAALLDMGADPMARSKVPYKFDVMMTSAVFGRGDIIAKWCGRFPTWNFSTRATGAGVSALGFLLVSGIANTETMDAFIEAAPTHASSPPRQAQTFYTAWRQTSIQILRSCDTCSHFQECGSW